MSQLDEICPDYVGSDKIKLSLAPTVIPPLNAFAIIDVNVDYSACDPQGIVLPLIFSVVSPSSANFVRRIIRASRPSAVSFVPREGGRHVVRVGELGHNHWFGVLVLDVVGETTDPLA